MSEKSSIDQILDLLLDALAERQAQREEEVEGGVGERPLTPAQIKAELPRMPEPEPEPEPLPRPPRLNPATEIKVERPLAEPEPLPPIHLERMLFRLLVGIVVLLVLVNIPFNRHGTTLARAMPDEAALIVRDGLVFKGSGDEVYVLENNQRRWITTLDAFEWYGYRWQQVHEVSDEFVEQFEVGPPIHLLLKCHTSPHVYALENGEKRWIKDIPTFEAQGYVWTDIRMVDCNYLRQLPDGPPIPLDAGPPPQP